MEETHYYREALLFIGMLLFAACQPEEKYVQEGIKEDMITKSKEWYNLTIEKDIQFCSTRAASDMPVKPEWSYLSYGENSKSRPYENIKLSELKAFEEAMKKQKTWEVQWEQPKYKNSKKYAEILLAVPFELLYPE